MTKDVSLMADYTIYHNPRCTKSRQALNVLNEAGIEPKIRLYLKDPFTNKELKHVLGLLDIEAGELLRKNEAEYKEHIKGKSLSQEEIINYMLKYPKLIQRPIIVRDDKIAILGRPTEMVSEFIT